VFNYGGAIYCLCQGYFPVKAYSNNDQCKKAHDIPLTHSISTTVGIEADDYAVEASAQAGTKKHNKILQSVFIQTYRLELSKQETKRFSVALFGFSSISWRTAEPRQGRTFLTNKLKATGRRK
jgi:hypothetical protein